MTNLEIAEMSEWKSKVFNAVAWLLGYRGENAYVILLSIDLNELKDKEIYKEAMEVERGRDL